MDWDKEIENLKKWSFRINSLMRKLVECMDVQEPISKEL